MPSEARHSAGERILWHSRILRRGLTSSGFFLTISFCLIFLATRTWWIQFFHFSTERSESNTQQNKMLPDYIHIWFIIKHFWADPMVQDNLLYLEARISLISKRCYSRPVITWVLFYWRRLHRLKTQTCDNITDKTICTMAIFEKLHHWDNISLQQQQQ